MKPLFSFSILTLLFVGCGTSDGPDRVQETISGTYVRSSIHEFGSEQDILVVALQNEAANQYTITRKWRYARVLDGKALPPEYKQTSTTATYDAAGKLLRDAGSGETWSYNPEKGVLYAGTTAYQTQN
jgi:hypothetical protein